MDLSNENGFQWEFTCNRCGNGFRSPFQQNLASRGRGVLRMAGEWFGGKDLVGTMNVGEQRKLRCDACGGGTGGGKFCQHCGAALIKKVSCGRCGADAPPAASFCMECGTQL